MSGQLPTRNLEHDCLERDTYWIGAEFARNCFSEGLDDLLWIDAGTRPNLLYQRVAEHECTGIGRDIGNRL